MIDLVISARRRDLGGFEVGRILPFATRRMVGPFVFLDHIGPAVFATGQGIDVRPHPHIGLSTVTYLFQGEILHHDNTGARQPIRPGEVNWMTAGRGIVHSERTDPELRARGGPMHGMQAWVALPVEDEETDPAFAHHPEAELPTAKEGGLWTRLIAGEIAGLRAGVRTHSPMCYVHWELEAGARTGVPTTYAENAVYIARGAVEVDGRTYGSGEMLVFETGKTPTLTALSAATLMWLGGEPIGPRHLWWNLVSSRKERIEEAKADWEAGRMSLPPSDDGEFIPLPHDPPPPPEPLS